jgi:hypothetical protein
MEMIVDDLARATDVRRQPGGRRFAEDLKRLEHLDREGGGQHAKQPGVAEFLKPRRSRCH